MLKLKSCGLKKNEPKWRLRSKKIRGDRKEAGLSRIRNEHIYLTIKELHEEMNFSVCTLCKMGCISRSAYYKWLNHKESDNDKSN